jgi:hypothetical protein
MVGARASVILLLSHSESQRLLDSPECLLINRLSFLFVFTGGFFRIVDFVIFQNILRERVVLRERCCGGKFCWR